MRASGRYRAVITAQQYEGDLRFVPVYDFKELTVLHW